MTRHKNDRAAAGAAKEGEGVGNGVMREYTHESASLSLKMLQLLMGLLVVEIIVAASSGTTPCPCLPSPLWHAVQPSAKCRAAIMQPHAMTMQHRSELHKAHHSLP